MNQATIIHNHLRSVGSISALEAGDLYRVRDLPKRISELVHQYGLARDERIRKERRKDARGQRYMRYFLDVMSDKGHE